MSTAQQLQDLRARAPLQGFLTDNYTSTVYSSGNQYMLLKNSSRLVERVGTVLPSSASTSLWELLLLWKQLPHELLLSLSGLKHVGAILFWFSEETTFQKCYIIRFKGAPITFFWFLYKQKPPSWF